MEHVPVKIGVAKEDGAFGFDCFEVLFWIESGDGVVSSR
jgi:hypothetical protein